MLVLVLDTSSEAVTAAVVSVSDGAVVPPLVEVVTINARGHGELLAPSIARALDAEDATVRDLQAVVAGTGPGPYTGLRVGLVTAAVMSSTLGIPAYGVCSLDAFGHALREEENVLAATDARRKEVYWARYRFGARISGPNVDRYADVPLDDVVLAGAGAELLEREPFEELRYPPAVALAECALDRIRIGAPTEQLTPLYLRRPDAVEPGVPKQVSQ
ncbi:MAG TPA: tRNA (adenosine(37)-N6)-threonylcarbamoyltransferase complex dimerization subunit type 1 TsaB [Jatrophihabitantaceae bacterium]|nr:tRNA (adenosine(37)-N6)-threonylcarbamoyltransferase complex dimerization subunit type 1 TsaB [Jatrophihabitantaceae bacterium]